MLRSLNLKNFKTWEKVEVEFGKITGFFGTNSSGKSSLIQFLLLLKQTKEATDRAIAVDLNGSYVNLGIYKDMIHGHDQIRELSWTLSFKRFDENGDADPLILLAPGEKKLNEVTRGAEISIDSSVDIHNRRGDIASTKLDYCVGGVTFSLRPKESGDGFQISTYGSEFSFIRNKGRPWQLPGPVKSYAFPDQARTYYQNSSFLAEIVRAYEDQIDQIYYLGPLRDDPQPDYLWSRRKPIDVGKRGEKSIDAILAMTTSDERRNVKYKSRLRPFQEIIAYWLKEMGMISDFHVDEIAPGSNRWQAWVTTHKGGFEALITDVGFGVSQILPVVTLLQYVPKGSTVILEQPEINLHPLAQAGLADIIINAATHRNLQIILESHSEHLLLRLQRRIAEEAMSAKDVRLYFCNAAAGRSTLEPLGLDLFGCIANWPTKFMGDAFGETAKAEIARLKRRAEAK